MRTVAFVSALGGVGCTTLVAHSAALLAERGHPVVALELSAQNTLMARSNSPTLGHPKFPQAGPPDYDDSGATAMRAAASLRR